MPFHGDIRVGYFTITFNTASICYELEELLNKKYDGEIDKSSTFWYYVEDLENAYNNAYNDTQGNMNNFWDWLNNNYNNVQSWNNIDENFI